MQFLVYRQEGNLGPFSLEQLQQQVAAGTVQPNDLAWREGMTQWEAVSSLIVGLVAPAPLSGVAPAGSAEAVRLENLKHEENVRSIGMIFYFNGGLLLFASLPLSAMALLGAKAALVAVVEGIIFAILGAFMVWAGRLFRSLNPMAKIPGTIICAIGLLGIPFGTLLNAFFLYLIYCEKGQLVLSERYREVVAATPQIQWRTALWAKILIGLVIFAFLAVVIISFLIALGNQVTRIPAVAH